MSADLIELKCGICGEEIWWDKTPNPICVGCADSPAKRLIAAAPDLLAAAKLAAANFRREDAADEFLGDDDHEAWTALNAAIAKAEGKATS
jgi:hypothetical protein